MAYVLVIKLICLKRCFLDLFLKICWFPYQYCKRNIIGQINQFQRSEGVIQNDDTCGDSLRMLFSVVVTVLVV